MAFTAEVLRVIGCDGAMLVTNKGRGGDNRCCFALGKQLDFRGRADGVAFPYGNGNLDLRIRFRFGELARGIEDFRMVAVDRHSVAVRRLRQLKIFVYLGLRKCCANVIRNVLCRPGQHLSGRHFFNTVVAEHRKILEVHVNRVGSALVGVGSGKQADLRCFVIRSGGAKVREVEAILRIAQRVGRAGLLDHPVKRHGSILGGLRTGLLEAVGGEAAVGLLSGLNGQIAGLAVDADIVVFIAPDKHHGLLIVFLRDLRINRLGHGLPITLSGCDKAVLPRRAGRVDVVALGRHHNAFAGHD